jgi:hypothetical protein
VATRSAGGVRRRCHHGSWRWLGHDVLKFHDGKDRDAPELAQFKGTDKPDGPTVASGRQLFMSLFSDGENEGKAVGL